MSASDNNSEQRKITILFLCTGNSCRSQMAEGWARHLHSEIIEPYSAGIERHGLNPSAVRVMAEVGVDISGHRSKLVEELPGITFDYVITLCGHAHETCPYFPGKIIHHGFPDPPQLAKKMPPRKKKSCRPIGRSVTKSGSSSKPSRSRCLAESTS